MCCSCTLGFAGVFFGSDFITVTKSDDYTWAVLKPDIFAGIMDHFTSGDPLFSDEKTLAASDTAIHPEDTEVTGLLLPGHGGCHTCQCCMSSDMCMRSAL